MSVDDSSSHQQTLAATMDQIQAGDAGAEADFTAVFDQLANQLLQDDPQRLLALVETIRTLPLTTPAARQQRLFYEALVHRKLAQYQSAIDAFDTLLDEPALDPHYAARALNSQAVAYELLGQLEKAQSGYQNSLSRWQTLGNQRYQGMVHLNLGILNYKLRRYDDAQRNLHQALHFFEALDLTDWVLAAINELGLVYRDLGDWPQALAHFEQLITHHEAAGRWEMVGYGLQNKGEILLFTGDLAAAETTLRQARRYMTSAIYHIDNFLYLGLIHQARGNMDQALQAYNSAFDLAQTSDRQEILPHIHYHLGDIQRRIGESDQAVRHWQTAVRLLESRRALFADEDLKISLLGSWQQLYEALVLHFLEVDDVAQAYAWAERSRARAFSETIAEAEPVLDLTQVQNRLSPTTTMLCYFTTGVINWDRPLLQKIPKDNPLREHLLLPAKTIRFSISATTATVDDCQFDPNKFASATPRLLDARRFLRPSILAQLARTLLPAGHALNADHIIVIPHGPLHQIPFTAVLQQHLPQPPHLSFSPSGTIFAQPAPLHQAKEGILTIGYEGSHHQLLYAAAEADQVAARLNGMRWTDNSLPVLAQAARERQFLHFACHAEFDHLHPLASYLEVGPQRKLRAERIYAEWRLEAHLVTLSACETGVSHILRGDEPMGLVRAFLKAGAEHVLVTQWPVEDLPTFLFMDHFYQLLQQHPERSLASILNQSQAWLRQLDQPTLTTHWQQYGLEAGSFATTGERPFSAPTYWAGFILIGH